MFADWDYIAIRVSPGKSIIVRFGQWGENTFRIIALSTIFLFFPQTLSVSYSMQVFTWVKSVIFLPGIS